MLIHFPNDHSGQSWADLKPGARSSFWDSHTDAGTLSPQHSLCNTDLQVKEITIEKKKEKEENRRRKNNRKRRRRRQEKEAEEEKERQIK